MKKPTKWTKQNVLAKMGHDGKVNGVVVEKAVYTVWLGQTSDEKVTGDVRYDNNIGFAVRSRYWGTVIGKKLQTAVDQTGGNLQQVKWGKIIDEEWLQKKAIRIARFHAAQVARVWNLMNTQKQAA